MRIRMRSIQNETLLKLQQQKVIYLNSNNFSVLHIMN